MNESGTEPARPGASWDRAAYRFLYLFVVADLVSISVAQMAAAGLFVAWIGGLRARNDKWDRTPLFIPFVAFIFFSLVAALLSLNMSESIRDSKDLIHIGIFFATADLLRRDPARIRTVLRLLCLSGLGVSLVGLVQAMMRGVEINDRISGMQGMYMTYAGLLALAATVSVALFLFDFRGRRDIWVPGGSLMMVVALLLSLTRNAWLGLMAGSALIVVLRKPMALLILPLIAIAIFAFAPERIHDRISSVADPTHASNRERVLLWSAGIKIIADHPLIGVGQNSFPLVYPRYRSPEAKEPQISHLHNNFLELAAERGIPCLIAWLAIWAVALFRMGFVWFEHRGGPEQQAALAASAGGIVTFLMAGMFEYNFGDSEVQMLIYFLLGVGMAAVPQAT